MCLLSIPHRSIMIWEMRNDHFSLSMISPSRFLASVCGTQCLTLDINAYHVCLRPLSIIQAQPNNLVNYCCHLRTMISFLIQLPLFYPYHNISSIHLVLSLKEWLPLTNIVPKFLFHFVDACSLIIMILKHFQLVWQNNMYSNNSIP